MEFNRLMKIGLWSMVGCTILGSAPLVTAVMTGIFGGRKAMDETTGGSVWLRLMNISLPLAFVLGIAGFIIFIVGFLKIQKKP